MAVSDKVADATLNFLQAKLVDTVVTGTAINRIFIGDRSKGADVWQGAQQEVPIKISKNTNGGSFTGAQVLSTTQVNNTTKMTFDCKFVYQPSNLLMTDIALNNTEQQVADLMSRQEESDAQDMMPIVASQLYSDGTGNSSLDITGLGAAVDSGSSVATYGGLSRTTYPTIAATVTASGGTMTLAQLFTMWDTLQQDQQVPSMILTTKSVRTLYERLLLPNLRYSSWSKMAVGAKFKDGLMFREAPVVADSACTSGYMYFLNEDTFEWRSLNKWPKGKAINYSLNEIEGAPSTTQPKSMGFFATDWMQPVNQMTMNKFVVLAGNLICKNPRYNGVLTGITGI